MKFLLNISYNFAFRKSKVDGEGCYCWVAEYDDADMILGSSENINNKYVSVSPSLINEQTREGRQTLETKEFSFDISKSLS